MFGCVSCFYCCFPKFSAVWVINNISILAIFVIIRVQFLHCAFELAVVFGKSYVFMIVDKAINKSPSIPVASV